MRRENRRGKIIQKKIVPLSNEQIENIKTQLQKQGYAGKLIDYTELQILYQTYGSQIEEKNFSQQILEISNSHYNHMKNDGNNGVILKSLVSKVLPEEVQGIKQELTQQGYSGKSIDYKELQRLHQMYGSQMKESTFAQEVLGINYVTYIGVKNNQTRMTRILGNSAKTNTQLEEIERIRVELQVLGYAGKAISYSELQELHTTYGRSIPEKEFAMAILELTYSQYYNVKGSKWNATILKSLVVTITNEEVERIKEELGVQGYTNRFVTYSQIQELHRSYDKQMTEREFVQRVLEISDWNYGGIKAGRLKRVRILRDHTIEDKEEKKMQSHSVSLQESRNSNQIEEIKKRLIDNSYTGKAIDYKELQELHRKYGSQLAEKDFAELVLELTYGQYTHVKVTGNVIILKSEAELIEKEYIEQTRKKLEEQGYVGQSINYEQLQLLYQSYCGFYSQENFMTESKFAQRVLEIGSSQYKRMKKGTRNSIILKSLIKPKQVSQEEIDRIKQELETQGYSDKKINYTEFQSLYAKYESQMPEYKFAEEVLGISRALLRNMRRLPKAKARILKGLATLISEEEIEAIKEVLEEKGYGGRLITYSKLQELHQTYGNQMREDVFAQVVLEISHIEYYRKIKDGRQGTTKILCYNEKMKLIQRMLFSESRWYSKEEIEQICKENGVSLDKVIRNIASNGTSLYNEEYIKELNKKGKLWIGKVRMSNNFIEENLGIIMKKAKMALRSTKRRYAITYNSEDEDRMQDAILWLIENAGDIEKNFRDYPDILERMIFNKIRKHIVIDILYTYRVRVKTISLNKRLTPKKKADEAKEGEELGSRISSGYSLEEDVLEREKVEEQQRRKNKQLQEETNLAAIAINEMKKQIEEGLEKQAILANIVKQFGLSKEELLKLMQDYLITNGAVTIRRGTARWNEER